MPQSDDITPQAGRTLTLTVYPSGPGQPRCGSPCGYFEDEVCLLNGASVSADEVCGAWRGAASYRFHPASSSVGREADALKFRDLERCWDCCCPCCGRADGHQPHCRMKAAVDAEGPRRQEGNEQVGDRQLQLSAVLPVIIGLASEATLRVDDDEAVGDAIRMAEACLGAPPPMILMTLLGAASARALETSREHEEAVTSLDEYLAAMAPRKPGL